MHGSTAKSDNDYERGVRSWETFNAKLLQTTFHALTEPTASQSLFAADGHADFSLKPLLQRLNTAIGKAPC